MKPELIGHSNLNIRIPVIRPTMVSFERMRREFEEVCASGAITMGMYTQRLEELAREKLGVREAVACSSCTSGLIAALSVLGVTGEVIMPSFTWCSTGHAALWNGLKPVFADCDPETFCLDPAAAAAALTEKTGAIMPVHIFGVPCECAEFERLAADNGLELIFDAAQAVGADYHGKLIGAFGDAEVISLSPTKPVTAAEGGLILTSDADLAAELRAFMDYGKCGTVDEPDVGRIGLSARMSEFHAIIGYHNLMMMEQCRAHRLKSIDHYRDRLSGIEGVRFQKVPEGRRSSGNYMVIFISGETKGMSRRDYVFQGLLERGIQTKKYFYPCLHKLSAYTEYSNQNLPVAEKASRQGLALPLYGHIQRETVDTVCDEVLQLLKR